MSAHEHVRGRVQGGKAGATASALPPRTHTHPPTHPCFPDRATSGCVERAKHVLKRRNQEWQLSEAQQVCACEVWAGWVLQGYCKYCRLARGSSRMCLTHEAKTQACCVPGAAGAA